MHYRSSSFVPYITTPNLLKHNDQANPVWRDTVVADDVESVSSKFDSVNGRVDVTISM